MQALLHRPSRPSPGPPSGDITQPPCGRWALTEFQLTAEQQGRSTCRGCSRPASLRQPGGPGETEEPLVAGPWTPAWRRDPLSLYSDIHPAPCPPHQLEPLSTSYSGSKYASLCLCLWTVGGLFVSAVSLPQCTQWAVRFRLTPSSWNIAQRPWFLFTSWC